VCVTSTHACIHTHTRIHTQTLSHTHTYTHTHSQAQAPEGQRPCKASRHELLHNKLERDEVMYEQTLRQSVADEFSRMHLGVEDGGREVSVEWEIKLRFWV